MANATAYATLLEKCFDEQLLVLMPDIEKKINNFIFPIQFVITVVGNLLTMTVLLSGHLKNRANHLLASLALCDMLVFVMMVPHYLASLDYLSDWPSFRLFHYHSKPHFGALSNWFSAAAIWFVLAVSVERLLIIKFPFRSLDVYNTKQIVFVSVGIMLFTLVLTSYHHFSHTCLSFLACHGSQVLGRCYPNTEPLIGKRANPTTALVKAYLHFSVFANAILAVLLPIFAVAILNISLIRLVKRRHSQELLMRSAMPSNRQDQEKKMTHTVLAIVTCFTLTQGPSALVFIQQKLFAPNEYSIYLSVVANELVLTGKMLNVVLFCLTSETFRRRLWQTCQFWFSILFYVGRKRSRPHFSRSQSKSIVTQKTSVMYSPCSRNFSTRRISATSNSDCMSLRQMRDGRCAVAVANAETPLIRKMTEPSADEFPTPPASSHRSSQSTSSRSSCARTGL